MTSIVFDPSAAKIRGFTQFDDFTFTIAPNPGTASATTTSSTADSYDANGVTHTSYSYTGVPSNFDITINQSLINPNTGKSFSPVPPTQATVDANGRVTYAVAENATFEITSGGIARRYSQQMVAAGAIDTETYTILGYYANSLGKVVTDTIAAMIAAKTPQGNQYWPTLGGSQGIFSQNNWAGDGTNDAVFNPNCFAYAYVDSYCAVAVGTPRSNTTDKSVYRPILISPRHVILANHIRLSVGGQLVFSSPSGTKQVVTITNAQSVDPDIWVGYLSAAVTVCNPMLTMPPNWLNYIKSLSAVPAGNIPLLCNSTWTPNHSWSQPFIRIHRLKQVDPTNVYKEILWNTQDSTNQFYPWDSDVKPGDSGGMITMPLMQDGVPKLILLTTFSGVTVGYDYAGWSPQINAAMNAIKDVTDTTNYALLTADLSSLTPY